VITGVARRRRFSTDMKLAVVAETMQPGMSISCNNWPNSRGAELLPWAWRPDAG
jgi:hypothetical protein